jgi:hypothetical protein
VNFAAPRSSQPLQIGLSLLMANLLARPHVLALPLVAAWGAGLIAARDRGGARPLGLAALMTAGVNMHGGFIFGHTNQPRACTRLQSAHNRSIIYQ